MRPNSKGLLYVGDVRISTAALYASKSVWAIFWLSYGYSDGAFVCVCIYDPCLKCDPRRAIDRRIGCPDWMSWRGISKVHKGSIWEAGDDSGDHQQVQRVHVRELFVYVSFRNILSAFYSILVHNIMYRIKTIFCFDVQNMRNYMFGMASVAVQYPMHVFVCVVYLSSFLELFSVGIPLS